jgi:hypothetical protein
MFPYPFPGRHKIRIRLLADKPPSSSDRFLNVAGFEILTESDAGSPGGDPGLGAVMSDPEALVASRS